MSLETFLSCQDPNVQPDPETLRLCSFEGPLDAACRRHLKSLGHTNFALRNFPLHDAPLGTGHDASTSAFVALASLVLVFCVAFVPSQKIFKLACAKMASSELDYKKIEQELFGNDSVLSESANNKILDQIKAQTKSRDAYYLASRYELKKGSNEKVCGYIKLAKYRCGNDPYAKYIYENADKNWTLQEARKILLPWLENPEQNIDLGTPEIEEKVEVQETPKAAPIPHLDALKKACKLYKDGNFTQCLEHFNKGLELAKDFDDQFDKNTEDCIKILTAMAETNIGSPSRLTKALEIYKSLVGIKGELNSDTLAEAGQAEKYPWAMLGMAANLQKHFRYKLAAKAVARGLSILEKKGATLKSYTWPGTNEELMESKAQALMEAFEKLKVAFPPKPVAFCRYEKCKDHQNIPCDEIFLQEPDFNGYVIIVCESKCRIGFHTACWKAYKESVEKDKSKQKQQDKDMLLTKCPTDGCMKEHNNALHSQIEEYIVYGKEGEIKSRKIEKVKASPEPEAKPAPAPPQAQPKKKKKKAAPVEVALKAAPAPKASPAKVNRGNAWISKVTAAAEPDENAIIASIVNEKIPLLRIANGQSSLFASAYENDKENSGNTLWYLCAKDLLETNGGILNKTELFKLFQQEHDALADFRKWSNVGDDRPTRPISKSEFYSALLAHREIGCVDDFVCLSKDLPTAYTRSVSEFETLYEQMFKVKLQPGQPKTVAPAPKYLGGVGRERRDSVGRERRDSTGRDRRDSIGRERRDSESSNSSNRERRFSGPVKAPSFEQPLTNGTPVRKLSMEISQAPTVAEATAVYLENEFQNLNGAAVFSAPAAEEGKKVESAPVTVNGINGHSESPEPRALDIVPSKQSVTCDGDSDVKFQLELQTQKCAALEKQLSEMKAKQLELEKQLEINRLSERASFNSIQDMRKQHKEREKLLQSECDELKAKLVHDSKAKDEELKKFASTKKELLETKKLLDSMESAGTKTVKQDEILAAMTRKYYLLLQKVTETYHKMCIMEKKTLDDIFEKVLDPLYGLISEEAYMEALQYTQNLESIMNNVEGTRQTLKNQLDQVKNAHKNPEVHWDKLQKIEVPLPPEWPECKIFEEVKRCLIKYKESIAKHGEATATANESEAQEAAALDVSVQPFVPRPASGPPPTPEFMPQQGPPIFMPPGNPYQQMPMFGGPPRYPPQLMGLRPFFGPNAPVLQAQRERSSSPHSEAPSLRGFVRQTPSPSSSTSSVSSLGEATALSGSSYEPPPTPVLRAQPPPGPQRRLVPTQVMNHASRIMAPSRTIADTLKKPEAPRLAISATRVSESDIKIAAFGGFAGLEKKLGELSKLLPHICRDDFLQALHWMCLRSGDYAVSVMSPADMQEDICGVLTELLLTDTQEHLNASPSSSRSLEHQLPNMECSICYENFRELTDQGLLKPVHMLTCKHLFHKACIRNWLDFGSESKKGCPNCRKDVNKPTSNAEFPRLGHR